MAGSIPNTESTADTRGGSVGALVSVGRSTSTFNLFRSTSKTKCPSSQSDRK